MRQLSAIPTAQWQQHVDLDASLHHDTELEELSKWANGH
jgi:hypothetical protein